MHLTRGAPWIVTHGGDAFAALGAGRSLGTRLFSLSGAVRRPGVYEVELAPSPGRARPLLCVHARPLCVAAAG